jgi:hypothetical protein
LKLIYTVSSTAFIAILTFLLSHSYTSQQYILLLYIGYLIILTSLTVILINTDNKPTVLFIVLVTFMLLIVIKPYMAINSYAFVLLDAHNAICIGIEYFQYVLNGSYIHGNAKGPLNLPRSLS